MKKPTTIQWITLAVALFALGIALGYMLGDIYSSNVNVQIYQFGLPAAKATPWGM